MMDCVKTLKPKRKTECVNHVYHIADIHIRILERHQEYKDIFNKFKKDILQDNTTKLLVICGDIFHQKDRFTSETMILFQDFISELKEIIDIIIILGNHDYFQNNKGRLDALMGFGYILQDPRVFILKNSGYYRYSNLLFGVSSIVDGGMCLNPNSVKEAGDTTVGLYHGYVSNETTAESIEYTQFKEYDLVLLGDLHNHHFVDPNKTIGYPGSLIQQSHKEHLNHGYIIWDIENKCGRFQIIKHDYQFMDIIQGSDLDSIQFPNYLRLRLVVSPGDLEMDIQAYIEDIKSRCKVISCKKIMRQQVKHCVPEILQLNSDTSAITEKEIIQKLTVKWNVQENAECILDIHNQISQETVDMDLNYLNCCSWSIKKMEFRNIFCFGDDVTNMIIFDEGITGILATNAAGKTNILNTILYGLFGNIYSRAQNEMNRNITNKGVCKKNTFVKLVIVMETGVEYYITRTSKTRTRMGSTLLTETLDLQSDTKSLNEVTKPETEKVLRQILCIDNKSDFITTNMITNVQYNGCMSIVNMNGPQIDEMFNSMFNLNKFKTIHEKTKSYLKEYNAKYKDWLSKIDILQKHITNAECNGIETEILKLQKEYDVKETHLTQMTIDISVLDNKILGCVEKGELEISQDPGSIIALIQSNQLLIDKANDITDLVSKEMVYDTEYTRLYQEYKNLDLTGIDIDGEIPQDNGSNIRSIDEITKDLIHYMAMKTKVEFNTDISQEYIQAKKFIKEQRNDMVFNTEDITKKIKSCVKSEKGDFYILTPEYRNSILADLGKTYINPAELLAYQKIISDKETRDKILRDNLVVMDKINSLQKELKWSKIKFARKLKKQINNLVGIQDQIDAYHHNVKLQKQMDSIQINKQLPNFLQEKISMDKRILTCKLEMRKIQDTISRKSQVKDTCNENIKQKTDLTEKANEIEKTIKIYKTYMDITHQKNLPKLLISGIVKEISKDANVLIYNTTGLLVHFQENDKWEITINKGGMQIGPEHCSGFERFVINTSLKITIDKYKQMSSAKIFLVDEVIDCVAEDNMESIDIILEALRKNYRTIFVISHNWELKKKMDRQIELEKTSTSSRIL